MHSAYEGAARTHDTRTETPPAREVLWWRENEYVVRAHLPDLLPRLRCKAPSSLNSSSEPQSSVTHEAAKRSSCDFTALAVTAATAVVSYPLSGTSHRARLDGGTSLLSDPSSTAPSSSAWHQTTTTSSGTPSRLESPTRMEVLPRLVRMAHPTSHPPRSMFTLPSDLLYYYTTEEFAQSLDASGCPADVRAVLVAAHASANVSTTQSSMVAADEEVSALAVLNPASAVQAPSKRLPCVRYNVHPVASRSQHSLLRKASLRVEVPLPPPEASPPSQSLSLGGVSATSKTMSTGARHLLKLLRPPTPPPRFRISPFTPDLPWVSDALSCSVESQRVACAELMAAECEEREAILDDETREALANIPFPLVPRLHANDGSDARHGNLGENTALEEGHPALMHAIARLSLQEDFNRQEIITKERDVFLQKFPRPFRLFLSVAKNGSTSEVERHLRNWIAARRGKNRLHQEQQRAMVEREEAARHDLIATDPDYQQRLALLVASVRYQETYFRSQMEVVEMKTTFAVGLAALRLGEQCARYPLLFGDCMSRTRVCARVTGLTVFHNLCIQEACARKELENEEAASRGAAPMLVALQQLQEVTEPVARQLVEREETEDFYDECVRAVRLLGYYTLRDVERYEAVERSLDLDAAFRALTRVLGDTKTRQKDHAEPPRKGSLLVHVDEL